VTLRWIRTFINGHKLSSFQDKAEAILSEPNPYYLLEWLVIEHTEEDEAFWSAWFGERTPGYERGSQIGVEPCFRDQLLMELWIGSAMSEDQSARMAAAFADLKERYGADRWEAGVLNLYRRAEQSAERYALYLEQLAADTAKLEEEGKREKKELQEEAAEYDDGDFDLEAEQRKAQAKWERKRQELPGKVLQRMYPEDGLLRYMAVSGMPNPAERLRNVAERAAASSSHPILAWVSALAAGDFPALERLSQARLDAKEWGGWFASYMSRNELTRGWLPTEERQRHALRWIAAVPEASEGLWIETAFRAAGWEERLAEVEFAESPLHAIVWHAVRDEEKRKRLREELVLQRWDAFAERFTKVDAEQFSALSWVFILDPESVQQRLLRAGSFGLRAEELIRKLCLLYGEGIRRGLDVKLIVSLYTYLAKHDKESFYSFVHGTKELEEALPMLELPASTLSMLFRGEGVRQTGARKHLLSLFYGYLDDTPAERLQPTTDTLQKLAGILTFDKRAAVVGWLQRHDRDWRQSIGNDEERAFTRLLRFRWIGTASDTKEQHRAVQEWLQRHSDWVVFETDAPNVEGKGVSYKIVKPGAIDAETGELLTRAVVRAEWADRGEVSRLLDDLKLL
jgi:Skp family chaperone for outer membrane proteins